MRKFPPGRMGWDFFALKAPIFGQLVEKNIIARTMRTLGTLVASGVPILEALHITRETSGNAAFEKMFGQVYDSIREGESIAKPMNDNSFVLKNPGAMGALVFMGIMLFPIGLGIGSIIAVFVDFGMTPARSAGCWGPAWSSAWWWSGLLALFLAYRLRNAVLDDMVVNMVDVGEETGELDTMLYKVADTFDEEVAVLTESLTALMEPLLIITLGGIVGFIVIALFMPLISLISNLSGGK